MNIEAIRQKGAGRRRKYASQAIREALANKRSSTSWGEFLHDFSPVMELHPRAARIFLNALIESMEVDARILTPNDMPEEVYWEEGRTLDEVFETYADIESNAIYSSSIVCPA